MKRVVVLFVARHSYIYDEKMVSGLAKNGCRVLSVVSLNMDGIQTWRNMQGVSLFEIDGYTDHFNFFSRLLLFFLRDAKRLKKRVREFHGDVVYIPHCTYWTYFMYRVIGSLPVVYTMHDPKVHDTGTREIKIMALFHDYFARNAKKIIVLSRTFKKYAVKKYNKSPSDIMIIPSGAEHAETRQADAKKLVHYDSSKYNFLFYGSISRHKGLNILANVYQKIACHYPVTLTVAGSGNFEPYRKVYENLPDCTVINRWIKDEEIEGLFDSRNVVLVLPYLEATQSGVIHVAMPLGVPVIATRCGGITEQIRDGKTGFLADPGSEESLYHKMQYVIRHWDELDVIRNNAKKRMDGLSWDTLSRKLTETIEQIQET